MFTLRGLYTNGGVLFYGLVLKRPYTGKTVLLLSEAGSDDSSMSVYRHPSRKLAVLVSMLEMATL